MSLMSLRQYARHRGCSLAAVQKAIASGRIKIAKEETSGQKTYKYISAIDADVDWQNNTDPVQQRTATRKDKGIHESLSPYSSVPSSDNSEQITLFPDASKEKQNHGGGESKTGTGTHGEIYNKARAVRETFAAKKEELEYRKMLGELVEVESVRAQLFSFSSEIKQNLLTIPSRISPLIYSLCMAFIEEFKENKNATVNQKEIDDILSGEITKCLEAIVNGHFGV